MGKKLRILLAGLLVVVLCALAGLVWLSTGAPEPTYKGKPLSYWLAGYDRSSGPPSTNGPPLPDWQDANKAVKAIGTNAVPILMRKLRQNDSKLKTAVMDLLRKQRLIKLNLPPQFSNFTAARAFSALGPLASNAVPELVAMFDSDRSPFAQQVVPQILSEIGPGAAPAIPMLLRGTTHTNVIVRNNSVYALGRIGTEATLVVPALIQCLVDPDALIRAQAANALGNLGKDAESAVPALVQLWGKEPHNLGGGDRLPFNSSVSVQWQSPFAGFGYTPPDVAGVTAAALRKIDPEAEKKLDHKNTPNPQNNLPEAY